jgi:DNA repair exonuclease SbcCD ATPase subunit
MKTVSKIQADINSRRSEIQRLEGELKGFDLDLKLRRSIKAKVRALKSEVKELKECVKVVEFTSEDVLRRQAERVEPSLKQYSQALLSLNNLATKEGWKGSKKHKEMQAGLKKEFDYTKKTRQIKLINYMLS